MGKSRLKSEPNEAVGGPDGEEGEVEWLEEELARVRNMLREQERETMKWRKKTERMGTLEAEKKKLERMLQEMSRSKEAEIEMLVSSLYELRNENVKIFQLLQEQQPL